MGPPELPTSETSSLFILLKRKTTPRLAHTIHDARARVRVKRETRWRWRHRSTPTRATMKFSRVGASGCYPPPGLSLSSLRLRRRGVAVVLDVQRYAVNRIVVSKPVRAITHRITHRTLRTKTMAPGPPAPAVTPIPTVNATGARRRAWSATHSSHRTSGHTDTLSTHSPAGSYLILSRAQYNWTWPSPVLSTLLSLCQAPTTKKAIQVFSGRSRRCCSSSLIRRPPHTTQRSTRNLIPKPAAEHGRAQRPSEALCLGPGDCVPLLTCRRRASTGGRRGGRAARGRPGASRRGPRPCTFPCQRPRKC